MTANRNRLTAPDVILRRALEKETQARDFYMDLAAQCSVKFVRELLLTLQNEENRHVQMIQKMLEQPAVRRASGLIRT